MKRYLVKPGSKGFLNKIDPEDESFFDQGKEAGKAKLDKLKGRLRDLQELLYAEHKHKMLIVLQAMDTGGKDGTIRSVFEGVNPQGVNVFRFQVPTEEELDHDYLWRVHAKTPGKGMITIFNRSHYEDVVVTRVKNLVPRSVWSKRFDHINEFERLLADEGTVILKFFLHISKDEQKKRLQERLDDPSKNWKFRLGDIKERESWKEYSEAYQEAISKTSTGYAPWYIIPANNNWYRNLIVTEIIVKTLEGLKMDYPKAEKNLNKIRIH